MGAINYGTSKYLCTLGYYEDEYYPTDQEIAEVQLINEGATEEEAVETLMQEHNYTLKDDFDQINSYLDDADFQYYDVVLVSGYYDGFYMRIDRIFSDDDIRESKESVLEELDVLNNIGKKAIEEHLMRVCYPGWCTGWEDTVNDSLEVWKEAIKEEKQFINKI
jgi:hypothetical protein